MNVAKEIEGLTKAMQDWYSGAAKSSKEHLNSNVLGRLSNQFQIISARGESTSFEQLKVTFSQTGGRIPSLRIDVTNVTVVSNVTLSDGNSMIVATYEEWQSRDTSTGARNTTGRVASAVLLNANGVWEWLHLHYTWLSETRVQQHVADEQKELLEERRRNAEEKAEREKTRALLTSSSDVLMEAAPVVAMAKSATKQQEKQHQQEDEPKARSDSVLEAAAKSKQAPVLPNKSNEKTPPELPTKKQEKKELEKAEKLEKSTETSAKSTETSAKSTDTSAKSTDTSSKSTDTSSKSTDTSSTSTVGADDMPAWKRKKAEEQQKEEEQLQREKKAREDKINALRAKSKSLPRLPSKNSGKSGIDALAEAENALKQAEEKKAEAKRLKELKEKEEKEKELKEKELKEKEQKELKEKEQKELKEKELKEKENNQKQEEEKKKQQQQQQQEEEEEEEKKNQEQQEKAKQEKAKKQPETSEKQSENSEKQSENTEKSEKSTSKRGVVVPTGNVAPIASNTVMSDSDRKAELEKRRLADDFKPEWKIKEEEAEKRRAIKREKILRDMALRDQGIEPEEEEEEKPKDDRVYLDDYYNTEKAIAARNIVRFTHFRHLRGDPFRRALTYFGPRLRNNAGQNSTIAGNRKFYAMCLDFGAGAESGALGVLPLERVGKQSVHLPFIETKSSVLDFAFDPFNDNRIAASTENGTIVVHVVPEGGMTEVDRTPSIELKGHQMKTTRLWWHPSVSDVIISVSPDCSVRVWNVSTGKCVQNIEKAHKDAVVGLSFDYDGSRVATSCKDGSLRVLDLRTGKEQCAVEQAHIGKLDFGVCWLGKQDRLLTCGFARGVNREWAVWEVRENALVELARGDLDTATGIIHPMYDEDTGLVMAAGKGDASIWFLEMTDEHPFCHPVAIYRTSEPQRGIAWLPKQSCDVRKVEIRRFLKLTTSGVVPTQLIVPRTRTEFFQDDLFPPTRSTTPTCSVDQWLSGTVATPKLASLKPSDMTALSQAPPVERKKAKYVLKSKEAEEEEDVTEQLFVKMNRLKGKKSLEDEAAELIEGVDEDEWDDY